MLLNRSWIFSTPWNPSIVSYYEAHSMCHQICEALLCTTLSYVLSAKLGSCALLFTNASSGKQHTLHSC